MGATDADAHNQPQARQQGHEVKRIDPDVNQLLIRRTLKKGRDIRNDIQIEESCFCSLIKYRTSLVI